jgi:ABC-type glycerol-3-phosphate transport system substrate-binding protein
MSEVTPAGATRRRYLGAPAAAVAAGALAACGESSAGRPGGTTRRAVTLQYFSRFGPPIEDVEVQAVAAFNERFAPTRVERTTITGAIEEKITTAFASETPFDVFTMGSRALVTYADPGYALPLDGFAELRQDVADFFGPPQDVARYKGKLYGMTYYIDSRQPIYRKDLLAAEGLPTDSARLPRTWEQFRDTTRRLATWQGGQLTRSGFNVPKSGPNAFNLWMVMVAQQGKGMLTPDGKRAAFDGPEGERALQTLVDFVHRDRIDALERPPAPAGVPLLGSPVLAGEWANSAAITAVERAGLKASDLLAPAFTPEFGAKPTVASYLGGSWLMLSKTGQDRAAGVELLRFLSTLDHLMAVAKSQRSVPPRKSASADPYLQDPLVRPFYDALPVGWSVPQHPRFTEMFDRLVANATEAMAQQKSVKAALTDSAGYVNALLAGG